MLRCIYFHAGGDCFTFLEQGALWGHSTLSMNRSLVIPEAQFEVTVMGLCPLASGTSNIALFHLVFRNSWATQAIAKAELFSLR